ncbi:MAG: SdrD B-like domain-containing protein [Caldilineaceae bacterium]
MRIFRILLIATLLASSTVGLVPLGQTLLPHGVAGQLLPAPTIAHAAPLAFPYTESFDTLTPDTNAVPLGWAQVVGDGSDRTCNGVAAACNDWIVYSGPTNSPNTGPSADHSGGGNYLYVEASSNSNTHIDLLSPVLDLRGAVQPVLSFWVHRFDGNNSGNSHKLQIDLMDSAGAAVIQSALLVVDNNMLDANMWVEKMINLTSYQSNGEVRIRFRWLYVSSTVPFSPDIAIDDVAFTDADVPTAGKVTGTIFRDYNANGLHDSNEPGIEGVTLRAVDAAGTVATTTSGALGFYLFTPGAGLTSQVRLEATLPTAGGLDFLLPGAAGNTTVQFIDVAAGVADVDVGFYDAADYCQADPAVVVPTFYDSAYTGGAALSPALISIPYSASGHDFTTTNPVTRTVDYQGTDLTPWQELGAVYGMAWQRTTDRLYLSAYHKRYSGFGPNGPDAIYQLDSSGAVIGVIELDTLLGIANSAGVDSHDFTATSGVVYDIGSGNASYDGVGKAPLGIWNFPAICRRFMCSICSTASSMRSMSAVATQRT